MGELDSFIDSLINTNNWWWDLTSIPLWVSNNTFWILFSLLTITMNETKQSPFLSFPIYECVWIIALIVKLSLYSLSLRESWHYNHSVPHHPPTHSKLFKDLRVDLYSSVIHHWNRQLKPYWFPLRKNRVN